MKLLKLIPLIAVIACGDKEDTGEPIGTETSVEPSGEPAGEPAGEPSEELGEPDLANGQAIHDNMCMGCHASEPAMSERVPEMEDHHLEEVIQNGVGPMPAQNVSGQDLVDLIAFLRQEYP